MRNPVRKPLPTLKELYLYCWPFCSFLDPAKEGKKEQREIERVRETATGCRRSSKAMGNKWQELISWKMTPTHPSPSQHSFGKKRRKAKAKQIKIKRKSESEKRKAKSKEKRENTYISIFYLFPPKTFLFMPFLANGEIQ